MHWIHLVSLCARPRSRSLAFRAVVEIYATGNACLVDADDGRDLVVVRLYDVLPLASIVLVVLEPRRGVVVVGILVIFVLQIRIGGLVSPSGNDRTSMRVVGDQDQHVHERPYPCLLFFLRQSPGVAARKPQPPSTLFYSFCVLLLSLQV